MIWRILNLLALAIPMAMVALGLILWRYPPQGPNWLLGFRSRRARASDEVWAFAQELAGKIWFCLGLCWLLAVLFIGGAHRQTILEDSLKTYLYLAGGQTLSLVLAIVAVNVVLLCRFDRFGRRRKRGVPDDPEEEPEADVPFDADTAEEEWADGGELVDYPDEVYSGEDDDSTFIDPER